MKNELVTGQVNINSFATCLELLFRRKGGIQGIETNRSPGRLLFWDCFLLLRLLLLLLSWHINNNSKSKRRTMAMVNSSSEHKSPQLYSYIPVRSLLYCCSLETTLRCYGIHKRYLHCITITELRRLGYFMFTHRCRLFMAEDFALFMIDREMLGRL